MQIRLAVAATMLVAMALAGAAVADTTTVDDRRNVRANVFDIKQATAGHRSNLIRHTIETYRPWRSKELKMSRKRPRIVCVYVWKAQRDAGGKQDFEVCSAWRDGRLRASVLQVRPKRKRVGPAKVHRLSLRSITYDFDPGLIGDPGSYQWQAVSGYTGKGCPKDPPFQFGCDDSAPTGSVRVHDLTIAP